MKETLSLILLSWFAGLAVCAVGFLAYLAVVQIAEVLGFTGTIGILKVAAASLFGPLIIGGLVIGTIAVIDSQA